MSLSERELALWNHAVANMEAMDKTGSTEVDPTTSLVTLLFQKDPETVADLSIALMDNFFIGAIEVDQYDQGLTLCEYLMTDQFTQSDRNNYIAGLPRIEHNDIIMVTLEI